jgi:hypothetical protein
MRWVISAHGCRDKEGMRYLKSAVVCFDKALSVYDERNFSEHHREILASKNKVINLLQTKGSLKAATP